MASRMTSFLPRARFLSPDAEVLGRGRMALLSHDLP